MVVNMDQLDLNIQKFKNIAASAGKTIRLATKSVRVPELIKYILEKGSPQIKGVMCYSIKEAVFLHQKYGYDDIMVAYPSFQKGEIIEALKLTKKGMNVNLMVDCVEHVKILDKIISEIDPECTFRQHVCIDLDVSYRPFGVHIGVQRSPCRSIELFKELFFAIKNSKFLKFTSVMGYEAQLSIPDSTPIQSFLFKLFLPIIKKYSFSDILNKRIQVMDFLKEQQTEIEFFNGGGTGTIYRTMQDSSVTELTVGSGFLQSQIFDYFEDHVGECAFAFALQVTRTPSNGIVTCHSGGFIASGSASSVSEPTFFLPEGLSKNPNEGFGEVQTPVNVPDGVKLNIGDFVLLRPAKAGEISERFNSYFLFSTKKNETKIVLTYRGEGKTFY